jgi:DNA-binding NarL/FixJ family response regulator
MISSSEQELMQLVTVGASDEQIARRLGISTDEVRLQIDDLLKRLALTERIELLFYACSEATRASRNDEAAQALMK